MRLIFDIFSHNRPHDFGLFGGDRNDGFIHADPSNESLNPEGEVIVFIFRVKDNTSCALSEHGSEISITCFGNTTEFVFAATRILTGDEAEPSGELPTIVKEFGITHT